MAVRGMVGPPSASGARVRLAQAFALFALVAGLIGSLGPADEVRTTYSWPPRTLPAGAPTRLWYTPLLLLRQQPEILTASIPCELPQPLPAADRPLTVLATARAPGEAGGLAVTRVGDTLTFAVGSVVLAQIGLESGANGACTYRLRLSQDEWTIEGGPDEALLGDSIDARPIVTGLFSGLDLRSVAAPSVDVTTGVHATATTVRQKSAWALAVLGVAAALILVVPFGPRRQRAGSRGVVRAVASRTHLVDATVAVVLVGWWVLSPVFWDDGWIVARERTFTASGGFSTYFNTFGVNLPLDYWVEWAQHWITQSSSALLVLRFPSLVGLAAVWLLCRWALARVAGNSRGWSDVVLWALAATFLVLAMSWGMTLRPEPVTALLATGVIALAIRFAERGTVAPLAGMAVLVPLALTAHHTGIVALSPVLAVAPQLFRWARPRLAAASAIVTAGIALLVVVAFAGSDIERRLADARTTREFGITSDWRDELTRYVLLGDFPFGTPLRRASVALIVLAILAFVLRRRRNGGSLLDLPATTLAISLVLLVVTPSKLPWHFGALIGIAALAVAAETARLLLDTEGVRGWQLRPFLVLGAALVTAAWSWGPQNHWNPLDLRTMGWIPGLDAVLPYSRLAVFLPVLLLCGALVVALLRHGRENIPETPWRVAAWTAPVLAVPLIAFTAAILVADLVKTSSWTLTRQNLESVAGKEGCGLAEDVVVPAPDSFQPLATAQAGTPRPRPRPQPAWVPPAPVANLPRYELLPAGQGSARSPWFDLPEGETFGQFVVGLAGAAGRLELEWGRLERGRVAPLGSGGIVFPGQGIETDPWTFLAASELPAPDPRANAVRITLRSGDIPGAAVAVTPPVTYVHERLAAGLARDGSRTLIHPNLLLYFPCAEQPVLDDGAVEVPTHIVWFDHPFMPHPYEPTSPFLGLRDIYAVERRPLADSSEPPEAVVAFEVDTGIPGAQLAPPDMTTKVS